MINKKKVWAIVCGAIRDELECRLVLNELLTMRSDHLIEGIIVSTWNEEFNSFPGLKAEIMENDILILESSPLESRVEIHKTNSINYFRQALQMQAALDVLPEDCFVLKARTDRSLNHLKMIKPYLTKNMKKIKYPTKKEVFGQVVPKIFEYPLVIFNAKTQRILHFSDFIFLGYKKDIKRGLNFDISELYLGRDLVANTQWFAYPFIQNFPVIRDYFKLINFRPLITDMKDYFDKNMFYDPLPEFFYRVYGTYLIILNYYFDLVPLTDEPFDETYYSFSDLFMDKKEKGVSFTKLGSVLLNNQVVENFLNTSKCENQHTAKKLFEVLNTREISAPCTIEEFNELIQFRETGWLQNKHWLREKNWHPLVIVQNNIYSTPILNYHFEELSLEEENELFQLIEKTENIDRTLYNYWLDHPTLGAKSAEQLVLPFARTQNQDGVMLVSRLLRLNLVMNDKNKESIQHLIEVVSNIHLQRGTANIKTVQMMLNQLMSRLHSFEDIYDDYKGKILLRKYLTKSEFDQLMKQRYSKEELANYFIQLANKYNHEDKKVLSLRLNELSSELLMTQESIKRIASIYKKQDNKRNYLLANRTCHILETMSD